MHKNIASIDTTNWPVSISYVEADFKEVWHSCVALIYNCNVFFVSYASKINVLQQTKIFNVVVTKQRTDKNQSQCPKHT